MVQWWTALSVRFPIQLSPLGIQALPLVYSTHSKKIGRTGEDFGAWPARRQLAQQERAKRQAQGGQETTCRFLTGLSTRAVSGYLVMPQALLPRCSRK